MIGDKIIFLEEHYKKADIILPEIMKLYFHKKLLICIGGESGCGKTEIGSLLQETLWNEHKIRVDLISIDDFYIVPWIERNKIRKQKGVSSIGIKEINWDKLNIIIKDFKSKKRKLYVQRIHKFTNTVEYIIKNNNCIDILIIEGLYANYLVNKDLGIYLEGTYKDTIKFRELRKKESINHFRKKVLEKEHKEVLQTKKKVDIIIPYKI